jgi:hypothetical protein
MQRAVVQRKAAAGTTPPAGLSISQPGDAAEREADRMADRVLHSQALPTAPATHAGAPPVASRVMQAGGRPLDAQTRAYFEPRFGQDLGDVRVHTGPEADESARAVAAEAYTVGGDIVFRSGSFAPNTGAGQRLLAHELAHVAQPRHSAVLQRQPAPTSNIERLRQLLRNGDAEAAIELMGQLSADEVSRVLGDQGFKRLAISAFDNDEMYRAISAMRGDLYLSLKWMFEEGTDWEKVRTVIEQARSGHAQVLQDNWIKEQFVDICNDREMAVAVDLLHGRLVQKVIWMGAEGTSYTALRAKIQETSDLAERLELYGNGEALAVFIDACNDREMRTIVDDIGGTVQMKLSWLLAEGEFNYIPERGATLPPPSAASPSIVTTPVVFALNTQTRQYYASVTLPGHARAEVAAYLYGTADPSLLGDVPDMLPPGYPIRLGGQPLSQQAQTDMRQAADSGTALRTTGETSAEERGLQYQFVAAGRTYQLTPLQMRGMLAGVARKYEIEAERLRGLAEGLNEVRNWHEKGTNSLVRGISDVLGDVDLPDEGFANNVMELATGTRDALKDLEVADIASAQATLGQAMQGYLRAAQAYDIVNMKWRYYIHGTIEGAQSAITALEITRDVSFGIAAGLAGAVAAPFAFSAVAGALTAGGATLTTGGALLASGAAIATGAAAGSAVKGTLEFTGASAQELAGGDRFDWGYVSQRTAHGLTTGAVEGGLGAVSHFQSAYLTSRFGQAFAATRTGQFTIGAISGGTTEFAVATTQELAHSGFEGFSWRNVGTRTAMATALGGATSMLPISGLYRVRPGGGISYVPLRGTPAVPEWMVSSPWHFVQPRGQATPGSALAPRGTARYEVINQLPPEQLPVLPEGYSWARVRGSEWAIVRPPNSPDIDIYVWGPDANGRFNFTMRRVEPAAQPSRMQYSEGQAGATTRPQSQRQDPFPAGDYVDPVTGTQYRRGHGIDHADTSGTVGPTDATADPANFSPQTRDWNDFERNHLIQRVRQGRDPVTGQPNGSTAGPNPIYREISYYSSSNPARTVRGEPVPDGVYMIIADANGVPQYAFHVPRSWTRTAGAGSINTNLASLQVPIDQVPTAILNAGSFAHFAPAAARGATALRPDERREGRGQ